MPVDILVVDDDININKLISLYLEKEGYQVAKCYRGDDAVAMASSLSPKVIILDIMLPGLDGWEACRQIRRTSNVPIIMLTAKGDTFDKVLGLELGADDYMVKPFEPKELVARVRAIIRRTQQAQPEARNDRVLNFPSFCINMENFTVTYKGQAFDLPPMEMELLYFLALHKNNVFTREQLLEQVWGYGYSGGTRTVDVHIKRLRAKFPVDEELGWQIKTIWSIGYMFEYKGEEN